MEMYDEERTPMKAFCRCRQTLCLPCLQHILSNGSQCPWDRTRWIGRNIMKKFQDATPTGLLETLRSSSTEGDANFDVITQDLLANSAFADQQYAMFLLLEEERHQAKRQYQERQDAEFAKQLLAQEVQRRLQSSKAVEKATKPNVSDSLNENFLNYLNLLLFFFPLYCPLRSRLLRPRDLLAKLVVVPLCPSYVRRTP